MPRALRLEFLDILELLVVLLKCLDELVHLPIAYLQVLLRSVLPHIAVHKALVFCCCLFLLLFALFESFLFVFIGCRWFILIICKFLILFWLS